MANREVDIEQIRQLVKLVEKHHLEELAVEEDGFSVTIKGLVAAGAVQVVHTVPATGEAHSPVGQSEPDVETENEAIEEIVDDANLQKITASMVGVYYRSPSPDSPHFVEIGDVIEVGQTIGLIEAMKVFSEIPSEVAGEVVEMPVANGKLVQAGDTLMVVLKKE